MKVSLIGAGPGDPGLLTLKGRSLLSRADVIIYDALANPRLLENAKDGAELIYVGKIADKHALSQSGINELLVSKAREGKHVARLKGGDPYIFGRGGEEAEYLEAHGIPFEEVPGVSSAVAAPAYAGIPLTHRALTSSLTLITGHEDPDKAESALNWQALAASGSTLVFLMGMKNLPKIAEKLIENGMDPDTPSALVQRGTTPRQRALFAPLKELPSRAVLENYGNPAVVVIGKVTKLHDRLDWFGQKALLGKTVVITRAREQASGMAAELEELGAEVIQCPTIAISPMSDYAEMDGAIARLADYDWILFTSVNGVKYFWERLEANGLDSRALRARVGAIGPATAQALAQKGINADLTPPSYVAESIASALIELEGSTMAGKRFLLPRAAMARSFLPEKLAEAGAIVDVVDAYETRPADACMDSLAERLADGTVDCICFGSSSTVENFLKALPDGLRLDGRQPVLAAIGPVTAATLEKHGLQPLIVPLEYTIPALVQAIRAWFTKHSSFRKHDVN